MNILSFPGRRVGENVNDYDWANLKAGVKILCGDCVLSYCDTAEVFVFEGPAGLDTYEAKGVADLQAAWHRYLAQAKDALDVKAAANKGYLVAASTGSGVVIYYEDENGMRPNSFAGFASVAAFEAIMGTSIETYNAGQALTRLGKN